MSTVEETPRRGVDGAPKMRLVDELGSDSMQATATFDVQLVGPVHHDLGDFGVSKERFERAVAEDVVGDLLRDPCPVGDREWRLFLGSSALQRVPDFFLEVSLGELAFLQLRAKVLEQGGVHRALQMPERIGDPTAGRRMRLECRQRGIGVCFA